MTKRKRALLDTDFISKLHITQKDDENRLIDRILELPGYQFVCHEQIIIELGRHNTTAIGWLWERITTGAIQKFSDMDLLILLQSLFGKNTISMFLSYLSSACAVFDADFYEKYYGELEKNTGISNTEFITILKACDRGVGHDNHLGEIKTCLLYHILQTQEGRQLYIFCSDDKDARTGLIGFMMVRWSW